MTAVALYTRDAAARRRLEALLRQAKTITIAGMAESAPALSRLLDAARPDVVVADLAGGEDGTWLGVARRAAVVAIIDDAADDAALDLLNAGLRFIVPRSAGAAEIAAAIELAQSGLALVPRTLLSSMLGDREADGARAEPDEATEDLLTPREIEVLAALADGASNKVIARRLGISFHTAKFHVASILAKLDADSRAEAVAEGARRGLVML